uniref:SH2 domain-containing protein n=1 Tax=Globodera pallida TaxID=36090 RepID=A0A183CFP7_GLOPA
MDSNNMRHHQGTRSNSGTVDGGALSNPAGNNDLLFSTLRHLATRNSESSVAPTNGLYNETISYPFQVSLSEQSTSTNCCSSNAVGTSSSSAWLDQAKLSLLPMYGGSRCCRFQCSGISQCHAKFTVFWAFELRIRRGFQFKCLRKVPLGSNSKQLEKATVENNNQPPLHYRTDELASADIELDRLVSLVASQNSGGTGTQPPAKEFTRSNKKESISKPKFLSGPPVFELPQFTPPESPTETAQLLSVATDNETKHSEPPIDTLKNASNVLVNHCVSNHGEVNKSVKENPKRQSAAEGNLVFIPKEIKCEAVIQQFPRNKVALTRRDTSKVPVYKLSAYSLNKNCSLDQPQLDDQKRIDDAYSFEEDELPITSCSLSEVLHGAICSSQGREHKLTKEEDHQTKTKRKYTKLHSSSEEVPNAKAVEKINAVYSILAERTKRKATRACFVSSELATDDHSVLTDIPIATCTLRNGNSNEDSKLIHHPLTAQTDHPTP